MRSYGQGGLSGPCRPLIALSSFSWLLGFCPAWDDTVVWYREKIQDRSNFDLPAVEEEVLAGQKSAGSGVLALALGHAGDAASVNASSAGGISQETSPGSIQDVALWWIHSEPVSDSNGEGSSRTGGIFRPSELGGGLAAPCSAGVAFLARTPRKSF